AIVAPDTLARATARGLDLRRLLAGNDTYGIFAGLDDLVVSGPTLTNVNDFRAILILPTDRPGVERSDQASRMAMKRAASASTPADSPNGARAATASATA